MFHSGKFELDQRKLWIILEPATPGEVANVRYFLGIVLERHGDAKQGRELVEQCAKCVPAALTLRSTGSARMDEQGASSGVRLRSALDPCFPWPKIEGAARRPNVYSVVRPSPSRTPLPPEHTIESAARDATEWSANQ
jgi:hypothetical protein